MNVQGLLDPIGYTLRMRERYGDPMSLPKMDGKPVLATGSVEGLRAVFAVPPEALDQMLSKSFTAAMGESSLFALSGARHTAMRRLLMPPFHGQRMRLYGKQICDLTLQHARDLKPGLELVAQDLMQTISLQTIIHLVFGVTAPAEAARLEKLLEDLRKSFSLGLTVTLMIPWLRREFRGFGPWARRQHAFRSLRSFLDPELARRRADPAERTDILSLLLEARQEDGTALSDQEIFEQLQAVFRPERFLERTYSPFEFLPFGGGNRRCIGAAFALYEMKLILGTLLRRYSFELVSKKPVRVGLQGMPGAPVRVIVR
ncbi:cytochrome P450 [Sorangium sp. So ce295]|uniref:cytochrome P450 n=1 Tax=Sorangium sp. So ce295 TaxID=3133295 RepID=UPI003F640A66